MRRARGVALLTAWAAALALTLVLATAWAGPALAQSAPEPPDALMYALEALGRAEFAKSLELGQQVLASQPKDQLAETIVAASRYWLGDRAGAKAGLAAVAGRDPAHLTSRLWLGSIFLFEADADGLARVLAELTALAPRDSRVVVLESLAAAAACQGKPAGEQALSLALREPPGALDGLRTAQLFLLLGRPAAARLSLEQSLEADPRLAAALVELGAVLFRENRSDLALNALRQALLLDKDDPKARLYLRYVLWRRALEHEASGRPDQGVLALRELLALAPRDVWALDRLRALTATPGP